MADKKTITLSGDAYDTLNEFRSKGKSFSDAVLSMASNVCGIGDEEEDFDESPKERVSKKLQKAKTDQPHKGHAHGGKSHKKPEPEEETEEE